MIDKRWLETVPGICLVHVCTADMLTVAQHNMTKCLEHEHRTSSSDIRHQHKYLEIRVKSLSNTKVNIRDPISRDQSNYNLLLIIARNNIPRSFLISLH